jgi:hypothetical protein
VEHGLLCVKLFLNSYLVVVVDNVFAVGGEVVGRKRQL